MATNPFYNIDLSGPAPRAAGDMRSYGFGPERQFIPSTTQNMTPLSFSQAPGAIAGVPGSGSDADIWELLAGALGTFGVMALLDNIFGGGGQQSGGGVLGGLGNLFGGSGSSGGGSTFFQDIFGDWDGDPSTGLLTGGLNELLGTSAETTLGSLWQALGLGGSGAGGIGSAGNIGTFTGEAALGTPGYGSIGSLVGPGVEIPSGGGPAFLGGAESLAGGETVTSTLSSGALADPLGLATTTAGGAALMAIPAAFLALGILEGESREPGGSGAVISGGDGGLVFGDPTAYGIHSGQQAALEQLYSQFQSAFGDPSQYTLGPQETINFSNAVAPQELRIDSGVQGPGGLTSTPIYAGTDPVAAAAATQTYLANPGAHQVSAELLNAFDPVEYQRWASGDTGHAAGGRIEGPGGPKDDEIPVWLSNKEYVMPVSAMRALGGGDADMGADVLDEFVQMLTGQRPPR